MNSQNSLSTNLVEKTSALKIVDQEAKEYEEKKRLEKKRMSDKNYLENMEEAQKNSKSCVNCYIF